MRRYRRMAGTGVGDQLLLTDRCHKGRPLMIQTFIARAHAALMSRKGVSAAEYAILAVGIIVAVGAAVASFQGELNGIFTDISDKITTAKSTATGTGGGTGTTTQ